MEKVKGITNIHDQRSLLKQLSAVQGRADKGVHTHSDYATLVKVITKLVKTIEFKGE